MRFPLPSWKKMSSWEWGGFLPQNRLACCPSLTLRTAQFLHRGLRAVGERPWCAPWGSSQSGFPYRGLKLTPDSNGLFHTPGQLQKEHATQGYSSLYHEMSPSASSVQSYVPLDPECDWCWVPIPPCPLATSSRPPCCPCHPGPPSASLWPWLLGFLPPAADF